MSGGMPGMVVEIGSKKMPTDGVDSDADSSSDEELANVESNAGSALFTASQGGDEERFKQSLRAYVEACFDRLNSRSKKRSL